MNEMTPDEKATYKLLLVNVSNNLQGSHATYNIARLKEFVEVINLRIEGSHHKSEWE
jgi:hypothetical protein